MDIEGRCHCGNIAFTLDWTPEPTEIPARACTCSFCVRHGGVWTSCATGSLRVEIADLRSITRYAFATKTAEFLVCTRCGIAPVATSRIDGRLHAVVSVRALENVDPALFRHDTATFDGESEDTRLERRARAWIGDVAILHGDRRLPVDFAPPADAS